MNTERIIAFTESEAKELIKEIINAAVESLAQSQLAEKVTPQFKTDFVEHTTTAIHDHIDRFKNNNDPMGKDHKDEENKERQR